MIGASGFLGSRLLALAPRDIELVGTGHRHRVPAGPWLEARLDATVSSEVRALLERCRPDVVFYVSYGKESRALTVDAAAEVARAARRLGARMMLISTDLVFDGGRAPYSEDAVLEPVMDYGRLKADAEAHVRSRDPGAVILRPALMVGEGAGQRRPSYECGRLEAGLPVDLFSDEWRTPVHVDDAARAAWGLASLDVSGTYHVGGPERMDRLQLGRLLCRAFGYDGSLLREARRPVDRPRDTSLDSTRVTTLLGWSPRSLSRTAAAATAGV